MDFVSKMMSLVFNMLSRLVLAFLSRSKHLLISWLQSSSIVILEPKKIKSVTSSTFSLSICYEIMGLVAMVLAFWILSAKPVFSLSSFSLIKRLFMCTQIFIAIYVFIHHSQRWKPTKFLPRNKWITKCGISI